MKKLLPQLLIALLALLVPRQVIAQDDDVIKGYTKVNINVKAAISGSGKVYPSAKQASVKAWREEWNFNTAVAVGNSMDEDMIVFYIYAKPEADYSFAGWYLDDGDGVFDIEKDQFVDDAEELYYMAILPDGAEVFSTEAAAKNSAGPSQPTELIWAYFTRGAKLGIARYQGDEFSYYAKCGSVWCSKPVNNPGDEITIEALANENYHFEYWADADELGNIISRENPYKFTVKGGERLYAYFAHDDAPHVQLPEEGGFAVIKVDQPWFLADESVKDGAHVLVMMAEDLTRDSQGRAYLDMNVLDEDGYPAAQVDVAQTNEPTIICGKGEVHFSIYLKNINFTRSYNNLVQWSGSKGVSLSGDVIYVYVFAPELGAFLQYGTTDDYSPNATESVFVPANLAYFSMSAFDLTDDDGNIPAVIGFSPETYDKGLQGMADALERITGIKGIDDSRCTDLRLNDRRVYDLSGRQIVNRQLPPGVYITNGRKIVNP